ncbi:MAG: restriction endonuclease subunit S, partial [Candidatus Omnitrophica bacterium]|nr:restriction endonuclease subunit S [Candidatus Omnitrophota bacterium]
MNTDSHKRYWIGIYSKEKVCLPPINEQHRILAKIEELFSELDKGVESLKKAREQLKVYRQALLKHAFEGKLTEHLPSRQAGWRDPEFRNISDKHVPIDSSHFFAYVLVCEGERLYKGFTSNLFERINQHLLGHGSKFTKDNKPLSLLHFEEFETEREALDREKYFKSGSGREWLYELKAQQEEKHPTADQLLERIKQERETRYQQQLEEWKAAVKQWEADRTVGKKPAKPKQINQIELLEQSELPELPFGWLWFSVSQLCEVVRGGSPRPAGDPKYYDGDIPFLKVADITRNPGVYLDTFTYTIKDAGLKKTRLVEPPVLMLSNSGATLGVPKICQIKATFNDGIAAFLGLPETAQLFHYYFWESKTMELRNINQGAAQPNLNTNLIQEYILPVCSELEMVEVSKIIEQNMSICSKIEDDISKQLRLAEALRQSILKKAFSGQLVSQDPNDEPASVLLDRIAEEKAE